MKLLSVLTLTLLFLYASAGDVTITCQKDNACSTGTTYQYQASGVSTATSCAQPACTDGMKVTYDVFECKSDFSQVACSSGRCYFADDFKVCLTQSKCVTSVTSTVQCGSCSSTCSGQCLKTSGTEQCIPDLDQCPFTKVIATTADCKSDSLMETCGCCVTYQFESDNGNAGLCTTGAPWDSPQLNNFTNWENSTFSRMALLIIVAAYMLLTKI